ncbi:MAG TPA: DNA translocase FtsK [Verrucomicrobiota bacterium]|nr:DNA translocase FtsK [Verrucomicrobiota bacterium]HNU49591.1 DNA translocase FtsK [Verrucomicrobiota bacterium]
MSRKNSAEGTARRGGSDVLGIVLICLALLVAAALFTFDKFDLAANREPPNQPAHNAAGRIGANVANVLFFTGGAAAYLLPVLFLGFAAAQFSPSLDYLRRRWPWAILLVLTCAAALDWGTNQTTLARLAQGHPAPAAGFMERLSLNLNAPSAGGVLGMNLNRFCFAHFGTVGAAILFATLWLICLYGLTHFQIGEWFRSVISRLKAAFDASRNERALARRARELEAEARELERKLAETAPETPTPQPAPLATRAGLGPDLKPVPEPTVRDLSVPHIPPSAARKPATAPGKPDKPLEPDPEPEPPTEVIPAHEVAREAPAASPKVAEDEPASPAADTALEPAEPNPAPTPSQPAAPKPRAAARRPKPIAVAAPPEIGNYQLPPLSLLSLPEIPTKPTESREELMANARLMQQTLAQFGIEVALGDITKGPTITRYELHPAPGVKLERITALTNNIAAALKAERIHILAPVPGKSSVGVEVPNAVKSKVVLRELLESEEWRTSKARVPLALGKDVYGHPIVADLTEMPHLLIAGSTGSGKSVCINAIVASLLYRFRPDQLRFVMIDPKVVELQQYNALPHLVVPVVTDPKKVILALRWVVTEMDKRYQIFARVGVRNIRSFNDRPKDKPLPRREPELPLTARREKIEAGADGFAVEVDEEIVVPRDDDIVIPDKLSYIVVIIDELADLMLVAPADVEMAIARITQMARAAGIHCIVATQRPSVDVITGIIKANIPCRIAFQVAARVDSRTILDAMGADKLLGKGDMLYVPPGSARLIRAQGALITDPEIQGVVEFITRQGKPSYEMEIHQQLSKPVLDNGQGPEEDENVIQQCIEVIRSEQKASVSLLQRRLRLGYTRAARIMDELEARGIVGPSKGAEPRDILIDLDAASPPDDAADSPH